MGIGIGIGKVYVWVWVWVLYGYGYYMPLHVQHLDKDNPKITQLLGTSKYYERDE